MEKLSGIFRFETAVAAAALVAVALVANVYVPYAKRLCREGKGLWVFWEFRGQAAGIVDRKNKVGRDIRILDSLYAAHDRGAETGETTVMGALYRYADSAGLKASKVEIGERLRIADHFETTITVRGSGAYSSVGRFCEAIENMPAPARIRQVSIRSEAGATAGAIVDFAILTK